jgi:hypothetical protein
LLSTRSRAAPRKLPSPCTLPVHSRPLAIE